MTRVKSNISSVNANFFIGSIMHSCIAALSRTLTTVSITYSLKFIGVMQPIRVQNLLPILNKLEKEEILRIIDDVFEHKTRLREHLKKTMPQVKETVLNLFNEIGSIRGRV